MTTPASVLLAAAVHLETFGWCRYRRGGRGQPSCVMGAIEAVLLDHPDRDRLYYAARERLGSYVEWCGLYEPGAGSWLATWNDHPLHTSAVVITTVRAAARLAA